MAVTKNISLDYQDVIVIGRRGENEAVDIVWDISPLVAEFGGGTALVLAKRATDESAYPVTLTEQTDTTLTWTVSSVDSCVIGVGKVQLFWYVGNVLAKSFMWRTFTGDDITGMVGDPPEAYESWLEHLAEMGADILNDAKDEVKNAEAWAVGERGGEPVVDGDETYHNNSKYWSGVSSDYAGNAESSADAAEQSAGDAAHQVELAEAQVTLAEGQVALAEQKVQDAAAQVALAEAQANAAAGSASDASGYALAASGYASDANTYKGQAYTSAQNAAQKASDAAGYASDALGYKNAASDSATLAGNKATEASGYANNASTYANNASGYADAASGYADAAAASATEAAGYVASLVNGKAGVLEDSASGDVVSIVPDKSVGHLYKAEVSLSPIQSLNGYDHPWAAGAGKNLVDGEYTTNASGGTSHITTDFAIPKEGATITASAHTEDGTVVNTGNCAINYKDANNTQLFAISPTQTKTAPDLSAAASIDIFTTAELANKKIYVQLEVGSSATAYAPYANLCPISGHTGATLNRTGKNLVDGEYTTNASGGTSHITTDFAIPKEGATITASAHTEDGTVVNTGNCAINFKTSSNVQLFGISPTQTKTAPDLSTAAKVEIYTTAELANKKIYVQLEYGSTATEWTAYTGSTFTLPLGQTVYGGTFDFVSGKLVVDMAMVDLGTLDWYAEATGHNYTYRAAPTGIKVPSTYADRLEGLVSDIYKPSTDVQIPNMDDNSMLRINGFVVIRNSAYSSAEAFKTAMSGHQLVYELATPIEIDLDPTEVETLIGTNNIWSDGEMSVDYAADLKTYIDNKIAAAVAALS